MRVGLLICAAALTLQGCFVQFQSTRPIDGGVFRSQDNAENFQQVSDIAVVGEPKSFADQNSIYLGFDPTDPNTMYYTTRESYVYVSNDSGSSWRSILQNKGQVLKVLVNPQEPCRLYALTVQNVFQSTTCGRDWKTVYLEKNRRAVVDLDIHPNITQQMYLSLSDGTILQSQDYGETWQVWYRFTDEAMSALYINPNNANQMYAATEKGFYRSTIQGVEWEKMNTIITKDFGFTDGHRVSDLVFLPEYENGFYTVSRWGILKSVDGGTTWETLNLLPRPNKERILSLAVSSASMNELYYSTVNGVYYSKDGGVNWQTLQSPTARNNQVIVVHPLDSSIVYIGAAAAQQ